MGTAICTVLLILGSVALVAPGLADAASSSWQIPLAGPSNVGTLPDGSVAALTFHQGVTHVTASGSVDWTVPDTTVDQGPVADSNGNIYWTSDNSCPSNCTARVVSVSETGAPRWSTTVPGYTIVPMKDGPDGLIYINDGNGASQLQAISKADGHIAFTSAADGLPGDYDGLFPFSGGVAVVAPSAVTYYSITGATLQRYALGGQFQWRGVGTTTGVIYVAKGDCGTGGVTTLTAYTQTTQLWAQQIAAGCSSTGEAPYLTALPDGGVGVNLGPDGHFGSGETAYNADGTFRWQAALSPPSNALGINNTLHL